MSNGAFDLDNHIRSKSIEKLRQDYKSNLMDWAETDVSVRTIALRVLDFDEVDGNSYYVPTIDDIVEILVKRIEDQNTTILALKKGTR